VKKDSPMKVPGAFAIVTAVVLAAPLLSTAVVASATPQAPAAGSAAAAVNAPDQSPYAFAVRKAKRADVRTWRPGCPVHKRDLRVATVRYRGFDGAAHDGTLVVNRDVVDDVRVAFRKIYRQGFAIKKMRNVDVYGGSDRRSMRANNTSAFNCRKVAGSSSWSNHAYGRAVDINPVQNPYVWSGGVSPKKARAYLDRSDVRTGMIGPRSVVVRAFRAEGWQWGGSWNSPDYQHVDKPR
jgi:hypothetical protein